MISTAISIDTRQISEMWRVFFVNDKSVIEIRCIDPNTGIAHTSLFCGPDYESIEDLKRAVETYAIMKNRAGYNIYTIMNQIRPDFCEGSATDNDIKRRNLLLIDIDRTGSKKAPASDAELKAAECLTRDIEAYLADQQWTLKAKVMSGNGYHLYYQLDDLENTEEVTKAVKSTLKALAKKFDNETVCVDKGVFNASRISKVPGTIARKGTESEERPYRMAVVL